jgi:hypothetical protein
MMQGVVSVPTPKLSSRLKHDGFMSCVAERPAGCSHQHYSQREQPAGLSAAAQKRAFGRDDNFDVIHSCITLLVKSPRALETTTKHCNLPAT